MKTREGVISKEKMQLLRGQSAVQGLSSLCGLER